MHDWFMSKKLKIIKHDRTGQITTYTTAGCQRFMNVALFYTFLDPVNVKEMAAIKSHPYQSLFSSLLKSHGQFARSVR